MSNRIFVSAVMFVAGVVSLLSCKPAEKEPQVTKDEQIYINELYASSGDDWIELYNAANEAKDLTGYKIYDDPSNKYTLPANTEIAAKSYLILVCDDTGTGLFTNFKLSSVGETVYLENIEGNVIDKVEFPALANGQSYGRYPDGNTTFKISGAATKAGSNGEVVGTIISKISRAPLVPTLTENVTVSVEILNPANVTSAKLFHRINGGAFSSAPMTANGTTYSAVIPALNGTGTIDYYVEVTNSGSVVSRAPFDAPADYYTYLLNNDPLPELVINEFMALNISCCADTDGGTQEFDDWIEIRNNGATAVNIAEFYLSDDLANPFNSRIKNTNPAKTTIPPGGYLLIWADNNRSQGELHLDFGLSGDGEAVGLYYKDGRKIDSITFGPQAGNVSMGRLPNGGSTWQLFNPSTPGQPN
ncbi:MAG TPA: lamin tail domain-containing protein [Chryseosolibacter sp.]